MYDPKSILQMARGAFQERVDLEMAKVIDNILDPNTKPTQKRKLTLTIEFTPDDDRQNIGVSVSVKYSLSLQPKRRGRLRSPSHPRSTHEADVRSVRPSPLLSPSRPSSRP